MKHFIVSYLKENYKWIALILSKLYAIFLYPKNACPSIFTGNPSGDIRFYNHTKKKYSNSHEFLSEVHNGDVFIIKNLIKTSGVANRFSIFFKKYFDYDFNKLESIHKNFDPLKLSILIDRFGHHTNLLRIQNMILKKLFNFSKNLHVELMPNLRPHLPRQGISKNEEKMIERRVGKGKLNSHGPHKDSWRYHPKNTLNIWLALTKVNQKNGLFVLPNSQNYYPFIKNNEIRQDCDIHVADHYISNLDIGDTVVFLAENLHGSIINQTNKTRFALSMRCSIEKPDFHKHFIYNYVRVKPSFSNLTLDKFFPRSNFTPPQRDFFSELHQPTKKLPIVKLNKNFIYLKNKNKTCKYRRYCEHKGADMSLGYLAEGKLVCKMHHLKAKEIN